MSDLDQKGIERLVEIGNDPRRSRAERDGAVAMLRKVAPHLVPEGLGKTTHWILTQEQYDKFAKLITENEKEK